MKANQQFRNDDTGVSNVLGGILFFALIFMFLVVIRVDFVPTWEEDKEATSFTKMQGQLAGLKSEADRQATNQSVSEVGNALAIGERSSSRFYAAPPRPGTLSFTPNAATAFVSAPELTVFSRSGQVAGTTSESWQAAGSGSETDIASVQHLRVRLNDPDTKGAGDNVKLTLTDADGAFAGSLEIYMAKSAPDVLIGSRVRAPDNTVINDIATSYHQSTGITKFWVDAMADDLGFDDVLRGAKAPYTMALTKVNLDAEYTITYQKQVPGGTVFVGGTGATTTGYTQTYGAGRLDIEPLTIQFPEYHYHYENGGVILHQDDGVILRVEPSLTLDVLAGITVVKMTVPSLIGVADSVSLQGTATVFLDGQGGAQVSGSAPAWTYTVSTAHPKAWTSFFHDAAKRGGLDVGLGEYVVSSNAASATLTIYGKSADPLSTTHDLSIDLAHSRVKLRIET